MAYNLKINMVANHSQSFEFATKEEADKVWKHITSMGQDTPEIKFWPVRQGDKMTLICIDKVCSIDLWKD